VNPYFDQLLDLAYSIKELEADEKQHKQAGQWKQAKQTYEELEEDFKKVRKDFVDEVLGVEERNELAVEQTETALHNLREGSDPSWYPALNYMEENLLPTVKKEAGKSPAFRKALKLLPIITAVLLVVAYVGTRIATGVDVSAAPESRQGIEQRADALSKVLRYDDWADTRVRRGSWIKGPLLWPIEPTDKEVAAAGEFAGLALEAADVAASEYGCFRLGSGIGDRLSDAELSYLESIAKDVRSPDTEWHDLPVVTVLQAARSARGC